MPLELLAHTVSHLKALIRYSSEPRGQGSGRKFSISNALLKKSILLHRSELVSSFLINATAETIHTKYLGENEE